MNNNVKIPIRTANLSDIEKLKIFFLKAYGSKTVFQNEQFLLYYFSPNFENLTSLSSNLIGLSPDGDIVSHYGGLHYNLKKDKVIYQMIWGVSAYTLPEWRGKGINSNIVDFLSKNNEINGVIGFTNETAKFYQKTGYNIFHFNRFMRYVRILDINRTQEVIDFIQQDRNRINYQTQFPAINTFETKPQDVVELTKDNISNYQLKLEEDLSGITTTHRSIDFLNWRLLRNPFIQYKVYGFLKNGEILTYIALREENLEPFNYKVNRIIDLYGAKEGISALLSKTLQDSISKNHIYIDFSMFGTIYDQELISSNFVRLEDEDYSILPQVTSPVENRPNYEFIGIQSKLHHKNIENLLKENVYFTRIDSDRDRLGKINQISSSK